MILNSMTPVWYLSPTLLLLFLLLEIKGRGKIIQCARGNSVGGSNSTGDSVRRRGGATEAMIVEAMAVKDVAFGVPKAMFIIGPVDQ
jgi:hypothetical protein